jgi:hypothetical protein
MGYGAEHDPILWAGALLCRACHRAAFPTDAGALGDGWIIATYPRVCEHQAAGMILIDLSDVSAGSRPAPLGELARYVTGRRCAGRNSRDQPCRSYALPGSDYCHAHHAARKPT